jgi:tetratricopeptide (TPR) repeat protein
MALTTESAHTPQTPSARDETAVSSRAHSRTRSERDRNAAFRHYAMGVLAERRQRYIEAVGHFTAAMELDREAVAPRKALLPLYLALDRQADALTITRQIIDLAPDDHETWYLYSRQLAVQGNKSAAQTALAQAVRLPSMKRNPEMLMHASLELARVYEDERDWDRAADTLTTAARVVEEEGAEWKPIEAYACLGRVYAKAEKHQLAVDAYRKAQSLAGDDDLVAARRLDYELAKLFGNLGKPREALESLDRFLSTLPPGAEPYELKARLLQSAGRGDQVLAMLTEATARDPNNGALRLLLAARYVADKQPNAAEEIYLALSNESPATEVYRGLFRLHRAEGRMAETLRLFNAALAENDNEQRRARAMFTAIRDDEQLARDLVAALRDPQRPDLQPAARRLLAGLAFVCRQFDVAEELYRACLDQESNPRLQAMMYDALMRTLWAAGKHQAVVDVCRKGLADANDSIQRFPFHGNLARALVILGKPKDAVAEADRAIETSDGTNRLACRLLRVEILAMAKEFTKAEADALTLLEESTPPSDVRRIRHVLSNVYTAAQKHTKAEEQLRLILKEDPDDATANNDLGYILADQGRNLDEAEELIRKALAIDERKKQTARAGAEDQEAANAAFIDSLGWVLFRKGRFEEAKHELERAVSLPDGADDAVVWDHLGDVYLRLGDIEQTRRVWEKARVLYEIDKRRSRDDQYKELKRKLKKLGSEARPRGILDFGFWVFSSV